MCKHQSCDTSSESSSANNVSSDCIALSVTSECQSKTSRPMNTKSIEESCSKYHSQKMPVGAQCIPSSGKESKPENGEFRQSRKVIPERKLNENSRICDDEITPVLQNETLSCIPPLSSPRQHHQFSLQPLENSSLSRRNSVPGLHNLTAYYLLKKSSCGMDFGLNFLKVQEDLLQETNSEAHYVYGTSNGSYRTANFSKDDEVTPRSQSRHYSIEQSWLLPKQIVLDEVLRKNCVPKATFPVHNNTDFLPRKNVENESLIKRGSTESSKILPMNTTAVEFSPDTIVLQRRSSAYWEVSSVRDSNTGIHCSLSPTTDFTTQETASENDASYPTSSFQKRSSYTSSERRLTDVTIHPAVLSRSSIVRQSLASSFSDGGSPICKICHMVGREGDPLISPCRCSGTMQFIHCGCLMKWLEISSRRSRKPPTCELCHYQYQWHKKLKVRHLQFPQCSRKDITLHLVFFLSVVVMIACATITILCFKQDKGAKIDPERTELTHSEIVTLICGVLFFLAFFLGMYAEIKARNTIYKLLVKFIYLNQQWYIDEYIKTESTTIRARQN